MASNAENTAAPAQPGTREYAYEDDPFVEVLDEKPTEALIALPIPVVDAAFQEYIGNQAPYFRATRSNLTLGSVYYSFRVGEREEARIRLRAIADDKTYLVLVTHLENYPHPRIIELTYMNLLWQFIAWLYVDREQILQLENALDVVKKDPSSYSKQLRLPLPTAKRKRRQVTWPEDVQARARIAAGDDREVVFLEWTRALSRKRKLKNPRDSFRHAIASKETDSMADLEKE